MVILHSLGEWDTFFAPSEALCITMPTDMQSQHCAKHRNLFAPGTIKNQAGEMQRGGRWLITGFRKRTANNSDYHYTSARVPAVHPLTILRLSRGAHAVERALTRTSDESEGFACQ